MANTTGMTTAGNESSVGLYKYIMSSGVILPDTDTCIKNVRDALSDVFGQTIQEETVRETPMGRFIEAWGMRDKAVLGVTAQHANQININLATGDYLDAIGVFYKVERKAATKTVVVVRCMGDYNTLIPANAVVATKSGMQFEIQSVAGGERIPESGEIDMYAVCTETGPKKPDCYEDGGPNDGNDLVDVIKNGVVGWKSVMSKRIDSIGQDVESDEAYRNRILAARVSGTSFVESIYSRLTRIDGVFSSFVLDNGTGEPKTYVFDEGKEHESRIVIPAHSVCVIADDDGSADTSMKIAEAIFKTKSTGSGQSDLSEFDCEVVKVSYQEKFYNQIYPMVYNRPQKVPFGVLVDVIRNNYAGNTLAGDVRNAVEAWSLGQVTNVDGLKVNQAVFSNEIAAAVSDTIPEIQVMEVTLYRGGYVEGAASGNGFDRNAASTKILLSFIQKATLDKNSIKVRVWQSAGDAGPIPGESDAVEFYPPPN